MKTVATPAETARRLSAVACSSEEATIPAQRNQPTNPNGMAVAMSIGQTLYHGKGAERFASSHRRHDGDMIRLVVMIPSFASRPFCRLFCRPDHPCTLCAQSASQRLQTLFLFQGPNFAELLIGPATTLSLTLKRSMPDTTTTLPPSSDLFMVT